MKKTFNITLKIESSLTVDEIWPDGDAPENPTKEDVLFEMKESISSHSPLEGENAVLLVKEWNLDQDAGQLEIEEVNSKKLDNILKSWGI